MTPDTQETLVIFRVYKDGGNVIALFPGLNYESGDANRGFVQSYQHVGQHGEADYTGTIAATRPAEEHEYEDLYHELTCRGYKLKVLRKKPIHIAA